MRTTLVRVMALMALAAALPLMVGLGLAEQGTPVPPNVSSASPEASPVASPLASPVGSTVAVSIVDFAFDAPTVEIPMGTTVTWTNTGKIIHTTTSKDKLWDSAIMNPGDTFSYAFTEAGTFDYWCTLHPNMLGTIVVTP